MKRTDPPPTPAEVLEDGRRRRRERRRKLGLASFMGKYFLLFSALLALILVVDLALYVGVSIYVMQGGTDSPTGPSQLSSQVCDGLKADENGVFELDARLEAQLDSEGVWGFLLTAEGDVAWTSKSTPDDAVFPETPQDLALLAHYGTLGDNPAFVFTPASRTIVDGPGDEPLQSESSVSGVENVGEDTLLVLVYPVGSRVTFPATSFSPAAFGGMGATACIILAVDLLILFAAYVMSRRSLLKGIAPLSEGIEKLSKGEPVRVEAKGDLAEIADDVNAASDVIRAKDSARANWISGVSHDIRTPLSTVMGYADRIAENPEVPERSRTEASIIRAQSVKMRDLVEDLNLASKLEYDLQPTNLEELHPAALLRACAAEFLDAVDPDLYEVEVDVDARAEAVVFEADRRLLGRAVRNLLQNAVTHNPHGCSIAVTMGIADASAFQLPEPDGARAQSVWYVKVADDGCGVDAATLVGLRGGPASLGDAASRRGDGFAAHGLGLLLVRGIARVHGGAVRFDSEGAGRGFSATLAFPAE